MERVCTACKTSKPLDQYRKDKRVKKDGCVATCTPCQNAKDAVRRSTPEKRAYKAQWDIDNAERLKAWQISYRVKNKEKLAEQKKEYSAANRKRITAASRPWYEENRSRLLGYKRSWYQENKERLKSKSISYYQANRDAVNAYHRNRSASVPHVRQKKALLSMLRKMLERVGKSKNQRAHLVLGYSLQQFVSKLEFQFVEGMSWENYGLWHIDHKIPIAHFRRRGETRPHIVNSLANLQPLWAADNISKSDSLPASLRRTA